MSEISAKLFEIRSQIDELLDAHQKAKEQGDRDEASRLLVEISALRREEVNLNSLVMANMETLRNKEIEGDSSVVAKMPDDYNHFNGMGNY